NLGQLRQEGVVARDAFAVGIQHHIADAAILGSAEHGDDLGVDRGLAAGELDDLGVALGAHEVVEDAFHFLERQIVPRAGVGEAERAIHVAGAVDLDDADTGVLLVFGAEAAVVGAAVLDRRRELERDRPGLVVFGGAGVSAGVTVDPR